jgi:hypothetical protein
VDEDVEAQERHLDEIADWRRSHRRLSTEAATGDGAPTLTGSEDVMVTPQAFSPLQGGRSMPVTDESPTLEAGSGNKAPAVMAFDDRNQQADGETYQTLRADGGARTSDCVVTPALRASMGKNAGSPGHSGGDEACMAVAQAMSFPTDGDQVRPGEDEALTLKSQGGRQGVTSTSSAAGSPARTSPSPGDDADSPGSGPASSSSSCEQPMTLWDREGSSLSKTSPDSSLPTAAEISPSFSRRWPTSGFTTSRTERWTAGSSEFPSVGAVSSSLRDVLVGECAARFSLSPRAAAGILRRAERRGRELPPDLGAALRLVASQLVLEATVSQHPSQAAAARALESLTPDDDRKTMSTSPPPTPSERTGTEGDGTTSNLSLW